MSAQAPAAPMARPRPPFAPYHKGDRNLFLLLVCLTWLGILVGFGWDIVVHVTQHKLAYPLIVHIHAAVFVGWMVLLTTQVLLIRARKPAVHKRLGLGMAGLAAIMVPLGLYASWVSERGYHGTPDFDASFYIVPIGGMLAFAVLIAAGFLLRADSAAHKRLMLLSTIFLSAAGFSRWWGFMVGNALGTGFWAFFTDLNVGPNLIILILGGYDLVTRGRLHPAFVWGAAWLVVIEFAEAWLYFNPTWQALALKIAGY